MSKKSRTITLIVALVVIVGIIWYIEAQKPPALNPNEIQSVALMPQSASLASSTTSSATSTLTVSGSGSGSTSKTASSPASSGSTSNSSPETAAQNAARIAVEEQEYKPAVELIPGGSFINSAPFTLKSLIGKKVVLIDFWTYSCINCLRTIPYLEAWYQKYQNEGLVIIGVHTPEFDFEKDLSNVQAAVKSLGITYPVMQDNNMDTWNAYNNEYWPAEYLINIDGFIVHTQFGEGDYDKSEEAIQSALQQRAQVLGTGQTISGGLVNPSSAVSINMEDIESPETYFGANRNEYLGNGNQGAVGVQTLTAPNPADVQGNTLYLGGTWNFQPEYAENQSATPSAPDKILYQYDAKNIYIVAAADASEPNGVIMKILLDGKPVPASEMGADMSANGTVTVTGDRLYKLIQGTSYSTHTIEIDIQGPGLDAYTFTFG